MAKIEVCYSPVMIHLHDLKGKIVVVTDIFRATSCMVSGIANGVNSIIPVATLEECQQLHQKHGYARAGERDGVKIQGFELGNSPMHYMEEEYIGKTIVATTTNGTVAIDKSREADEVVIGAFLNIDAVVAYLKEQNKDVLVLCAGWKGKYSLEDSLFAGALVSRLGFDHNCDSAFSAMSLYENAKYDLSDYVQSSAHFKRLKKMSIRKDIEICMSFNKYNVVPVLKGRKIVEKKKVGELAF